MSEELRPCPFCEANDWRFNAYFSGAAIYQCGGCGTIVDGSVINARPLEDALQTRIAELEALIERLVEAGQTLADSLPYSGENEEPVNEFDAICDEYRAMKGGEG